MGPIIEIAGPQTSQTLNGVPVITDTETVRAPVWRQSADEPGCGDSEGATVDGCQ